MSDGTGWVSRTIGSYELVVPVTDSPTGSVWRGRDHALDRDVALKQVAHGAFGSVERLRAEARLLARLPHPNIVAVIDLIETPDGLWLIEEWIDGATLPEVVTQAGRLTPVQAVGTVRGALLGLAHAHANQVVHGDVSPANLLLDMTGTTRLIDFGLAAPTGAAGISGTPGYLSPEAAAGRPLVPASDVYSTAAVLGLLLRGRPVFEGPSAEAVLAAQFAPVGPDLRGIADPLAGLLHAALAPSPADRPADAGQFLAHLDVAAEHSFGAGWWAAAGVAGLVSAVATAESAAGGAAVVAGAAAPAAIAAPTPTAAPAGYQPAAAGQPPAVAPRPPVVDQRAANPTRLRGLLRSPRALTGVGVGALVAVAGIVAATQLGGSPASHAARQRPTITATPIAATSRATGVQQASFDLHTVNWDDATLPGKACFQPNDITLHNGKATLPLQAGQSVPPGSPPSGYELDRIGTVQYGKLTGGPQIAMLTLSCVGTGLNSGTGTFWRNIAVFDGVGGKPHLLGVYTSADLGKVPSTQFNLVALSPSVTHGVLTIAGAYLHGTDPHCCPTGRASTTLTYAGGRLTPSRRFTIAAPVTAAPGGGSSISASSAPTGAAGRTGRTITVVGRTSGTKYVATVAAEDVVRDCAANSYGAPVIAFFRAHPCPQGASRRLITIPFHGRTLAMSVISVTLPASAGPDLYRYATQFAHLENSAGTGGLDDLLRGGVRPAGWPASIPPHEAFVVDGEDTGITIFDLWYLDGSTSDQDPALVAAARELFLTPISLGG